MFISSCRAWPAETGTTRLAAAVNPDAVSSRQRLEPLGWQLLSILMLSLHILILFPPVVLFVLVPSWFAEGRQNTEKGSIRRFLWWSR